MTNYIAHRGNLNGPNPIRENHPDYILEAIKKDFMVEVDVRSFNGELVLGHDEPQYEIDIDFLIKYKPFLWVHCKDFGAFKILSEDTKCNYFWHDTDDYTITSWKYVWAYPGKPSIGRFCVMVMPEMHWPIEELSTFETFGICSDFVEQIKNYK